MSENKRSLLIFVGIVMICLVGIYAGFSYTQGEAKLKNDISKPFQNKVANENENENINLEPIIQNNIAGLTLEKEISLKNNKNIINTNQTKLETKIIYNYEYSDGVIDSFEESCPYYMVGLTENELKNKYSDWNIDFFNENKVVMTKKMNEISNHYYIVGVKDGFIAVFYQKDINGTNLKEQTNIHLDALPEAERKRLEEGIKVDSEEKLNRIMEAYGS